MLSHPLLAAFLLPILFLLLKAVRDVRTLRSSVGEIPGRTTLFSVITNLGILCQTLDNWVCCGLAKISDAPRALYLRGGWDIFGVTSVVPMKNSLLISDAEAIKLITSDRIRFPKPLEIYEQLNLYGQNIVYSEGDVWKRFRKLSSPAFSDKNNRVVWDETMMVMDEFISQSQVWTNGQKDMPNFMDYALEVAIRIISAAGFGERFTIKNTLRTGHSLTFQDCLKIISQDLPLLFVTPDWLPNVHKKISDVRLAKKEFGMYLGEMIDSRKEKHTERYDLFSTLLDTHDEGSPNSKLTRQELLGNMFMFIVAGHETTAHTLCYVFSLLALYPEVQEKLYQHCKEVYPTDREPTYSDMSLFTYSHWVLNEALRLHPLASIIPKLAAEDTVLTIGNTNGETKTFPIAKDTMLLLHIGGVHYNERYWKNPEEFNPERFADPNWNRDALIPFSTGARSCIGRKFSETEAVVVITRIIMNFQVSILDEPKYAKETFSERYKRIMESFQGVSWTPKRTPLTFKRRN